MEILDLMQIPIFEGASLVAGHRGGHRHVHTVTMMDAPDIIDFVKPHELLVTAGFWFKENPENLGPLIQEMARKGCAGLGVKTKRYLVEIPDSVMRMADELAFPIIDLPLTHSLGDIVNQTLSVITTSRPSDLLHRLQMRREKNKFFTRILEGGYSSQQEILAQGMGHGLVDAPYYQLVVSKPDVDLQPFDPRKEAIIELIEGELVNQILFMKEDFFIFLCPIFSLSETIENWLRKLQDLIEDTFQMTFSFGVGNYVERVLDVKGSFGQAKNELDMGYRLGKRNFIQIFRNQSVGSLLSLIPAPDLREFYEKTLKELAQPLDQDKIGLLDTLNLYIKNNGNIGETAKQLFVHRNTVIYRLQKCEDLLGVNLKDPDVAFELRLALLIHTLINYNKFST